MIREVASTERSVMDISEKALLLRFFHHPPLDPEDLPFPSFSKIYKENSEEDAEFYITGDAKLAALTGTGKAGCAAGNAVDQRRGT